MAGKRHKMTADMIEKLKAAFANGFNDEEAALYCGVGVRTIYDYCSKNPDFGELKELLKNKPKIKAKMNLLKAINNEDLEISKWYLERKSKNEFSLKNEVENNTNLNGEIIIKLPNSEK